MDATPPADETVTEEQQQHRPIPCVLLPEPLLHPHPDDKDKDQEAQQVLDPQSSAAPFISRCSTLLEEIHKVQAFIKQNYLREIELRAFRSHVQSELRFLKNVGSRSDAAQQGERAQHSLRSSNLGYFELVWAAAKSSTGLCSILTHVHEGGLRPSVKQEKAAKSVQVEIIADDGLQWIKLNAITPKRLMYELARFGYEGAVEPSSESDNEAEGQPVASDDDEWNETAVSSIPLIRHADLLARAAQNTWVNYRHPRIVYLFQNLSLQSSPAPIKAIIRRLQLTGATVHCADDDTSPPQGSTTIPSLSSPPTLHNFLGKLRTRDLYSHISHKLNIDCTILLALISDISNQTVDPHSRPFSCAILSQLKKETTRPLLPTILFPLLSGHQLFCTQAARQRFEEIVSEVGTLQERARAEVILATCSHSPENLLEKFRALCTHQVPSSFRLPIVTHSKEFFTGPHPLTEKVSSQLTPINQSVIMTGWNLGLTTITSNMAVGKVVEGRWTRCLEEMERDGMQWEEMEQGKIMRGPDMWILSTTRSLVGKGPRPGLNLGGNHSVDTEGVDVEGKEVEVDAER